MNSPIRIVVAGSLAALCAGARAGDTPTGVTPPAAIPQRSFGLSEVDGRLVGGGPDYRAEFDPEGLAFTAAFGSAAPRTWPLEYSLRSIEREGVATPFDRAEPALAGSAVEYVRGGGIVERYESRIDGIEQTFTFETKPQGSGDLVVRGLVTTDLSRPAAGTYPDRLAFDAPGFGSVAIGAVTGIDALGNSIPGELRFDGDHVEFRLPAAFVDGAAYPLVLDPLYYGNIVIATDYDEHAPDTTFDASTGTYLVVWDRQFASGDHDIRGQRIDLVWSFVGGTIFIESDSTVNALEPRVGNMNNSSRSLVAWTESTGFLSGVIRCRAVSHVNGAVSTKQSVGPTSGLNARPDVGGEAQEVYDRAVVVWESFNTTAGAFEIKSASVLVPVTGNPTVGPAITLASGFDDSNPSISSHDLYGTFLVVWKREFTSGDSEIRAAAVDRNLNIEDSLIAVTNNSAWDDDPAVGGDGHNFLVAYETEPTSGSGDKDVVAVRVRALPNGQWEPAPTTMNLDVGVLDSQDPDVAWLYGSALVTWRQELLDTSYRTVLASVDGVGATTCENYFLLENSMSTTHRARIGGGLDDLAMVVRETELKTGGDAVITGQQFWAADGGHQFLSGPCGATAYASCARVGNSSFGLRLTTAPANAASYLILGTSVINVPCGLCSLVVDPSSGLFLPGGSTDANGELSLVTGIPNNPVLVGLQFAMQWLVVSPTPASNCPSIHSYLSNGLEVTLQ